MSDRWLTPCVLLGAATIASKSNVSLSRASTLGNVTGLRMVAGGGAATRAAGLLFGTRGLTRGRSLARELSQARFLPGDVRITPPAPGNGDDAGVETYAVIELCILVLAEDACFG